MKKWQKITGIVALAVLAVVNVVGFSGSVHQAWRITITTFVC